ncbi:MAG: hypothetical protein ACM3O6_02915 [Acidobacteriota bacterium]
MLTRARAHVPTAARCIEAALRGDPTAQERAVVAGLLAHAIDDLHMLRAGMLEEK